MSTVRIPDKQRFVLDSATWGDYTRWLQVLDERRHFRLTYDRGILEVVTLTHEYEHRSALLARLVVAWTEERGLAIKSGQSTTFRRRDVERGLEPDQCFWIANEALVRNRDRLDLRRDPPPDLVIEIDLTRSSVPRLPIYAALGMPEVWRITRGVLSFQVLQPDQTYAAAAVSRSLPPLRPADLQRFLDMRGRLDENAVVRRFREWVRKLSPPAP